MLSCLYVFQNPVAYLAMLNLWLACWGIKWTDTTYHSLGMSTIGWGIDCIQFKLSQPVVAVLDFGGWQYTKRNLLYFTILWFAGPESTLSFVSVTLCIVGPESTLPFVSHILCFAGPESTVPFVSVILCFAGPESTLPFVSVILCFAGPQSTLPFVSVVLCFVCLESTLPFVSVISQRQSTMPDYHHQHNHPDLQNPTVTALHPTAVSDDHAFSTCKSSFCVLVYCINVCIVLLGYNGWQFIISYHRVLMSEVKLHETACKLT